MRLASKKQFGEWVKNVPPELREHVSALEYERDQLQARLQESEAKLKVVREALEGLLNSEVVKRAPFITYSEAYDTALSALVDANERKGE